MNSYNRIIIIKNIVNFLKSGSNTSIKFSTEIIQVLYNIIFIIKGIGTHYHKLIFFLEKLFHFRFENKIPILKISPRSF